MPFISPEEIVVKAKNAYPRFLKQWIQGKGENFFPYRISVRLTPDRNNPSGTIDASEKLWLQSKEQHGWGYTVHREKIRSRDFGHNPFPKKITIDTLDDLLHLTAKRDHFTATQRVVDRVRTELPQLEDWLIRQVRSLSDLAESIEGLICVAQFFMNNPWPDCYARQIPVPVDTKFVDRYKTILRQWLDLLLPDSAIDVNESTFARRYGLRDGQPHRGIRLLDSQLCKELGLVFEELSLPLRSIATLPVKDMTIVIVENQLNLLTLPAISRGMGLRGEGAAVTRLEPLLWLQTNRVIYWGDIDVYGFSILSNLRNLFPQVESVMMDRETMRHHENFMEKMNGKNKNRPPIPGNLTPNETEAFAYCSKQNVRLEQEKILQPYVDEIFAHLLP